jgi:hypothetical protein
MDSCCYCLVQTHPKLRAFKQKKREVQCAVNLAQKLALFVQGDEEGFVREAEAEALELSQSAFGGVLLHLIGTIYQEQGKAELGGIEGLGVNISQTNRYVGTRSLAIKMLPSSLPMVFLGTISLTRAFKRPVELLRCRKP